MIRIHRVAGGLLVGTALAVAALEPPAAAQDRRREGNRDLFEGLEIDEVAPRVRQNMVDDELFDHWVFGAEGADAFRRRFQFSLTAHVSSVDRICPLTPVQMKKLTLAGRGDIKRFFDRMDEARNKIRHQSLDRDELRILLQEFRRRQRPPDLFGEKSPSSKSLKNTLTAEQWARYQKVCRDQVVAHHRTTITWVVGMMDATLRLNKEQHVQVEELLVKETRPPRSFGEYDYYGVMFQVSRLPETRLRPIFDDIQWGKLARQLAEAVRLEPTLKDGGFVPDDEVAEAPKGRGDQPLAGPEKPQG